MSLNISRVDRYNYEGQIQIKRQKNNTNSYSIKQENLGFSGGKNSAPNIILENSSKMLFFLFGALASALTMIVSSKKEETTFSKENLSELDSIDIIKTVKNELGIKKEDKDENKLFLEQQEKVVKLSRGIEVFLEENKPVGANVQPTKNNFIKMLVDNGFQLKRSEVEKQKNCIKKYSDILEKYIQDTFPNVNANRNNKYQLLVNLSDELKNRQNILNEILKTIDRN